MNISVKGEYALEALFDLAQQRPGDPVKIADIARRRKIPQKFLELILAGLKQGGFVESRRGAEGGYFLARPANAITVGQVLRFMESVRSSRPNNSSGIPGPFSDLWKQVDDSVSRVVDETTFDDLVRRWREKQGSYVPNWEI